jgi:hypothetical protein
MKEEPWRAQPPGYPGGTFTFQVDFGREAVLARRATARPMPPTPWRQALGQPREDEAAARAELVAPEAQFAIFRRRAEGAQPGSDARVYTSPVLDMGKPLTHLFYSVSNLPGSCKYEARWAVHIGSATLAEVPADVRPLWIEFYNQPDGAGRHARQKKGQHDNYVRLAWGTAGSRAWPTAGVDELDARLREAVAAPSGSGPATAPAAS